MNIKYWNTVTLLMTLIHLSCCSTSMSTKFTNNRGPFDTFQQQISANISRCKIKGRVSWHNYLNQTGGYAYLYWEKEKDESLITLYAPFNIQNITIQTTKSNKIKSITKNGKPYDIISEKELSYVNLLLPKLDNLIYWFLGVSNPKKNYRLTNQGFQQDGWVISYFNYKPNKHILTEEILLPHKIMLKKFNPKPGEEIIIKIIISDFRITLQ